MSLLDTAIWWQVYPLGALGAPIRAEREPGVQHRLARLEAWLDYVIELGCSGLLLGPVFESTSHGYDTLDHFRIDSRLGDEADFDHLVEQCRQRGLSIMLDGVFNHVGVDHRLVAESVRAGGGAVRLTQAEGVRGPEPWEGHTDLANLDHSCPEVADLVTEVMLHWLRRGIAGWRLDVAYAVPSEFWAQVLPRVRAEFPEAIFLGEVIHGDYVALARAGGLDSITEYELWKAIWSSLADRNLWELDWALNRHQEFSSSLVTQTFVGNHDVDRIASVVGEQGAVLALVVLMSVPGMPSIYYGDEQAFTGTKGQAESADDAVRPPLPETPAELVPFGWWMYRLHQELIGLRRRHGWIARGSLETLERTNETISYQTTGQGHRLVVRLGLDPQPWAVIEVDGQQVFTWPRD